MLLLQSGHPQLTFFLSHGRNDVSWHESAGQSLSLPHGAQTSTAKNKQPRGSVKFITKDFQRRQKTNENNDPVLIVVMRESSSTVPRHYFLCQNQLVENHHPQASRFRKSNRSYPTHASCNTQRF